MSAPAPAPAGWAGPIALRRSRSNKDAARQAWPRSHRKGARTDISRTGDVWWKNAVFYCLDVETFQDGSGDGIGDFAGLTRRIDYLAGLGVTCIWLMPFYPTAHQDDGYDITDYYGVDRRLGTLGDLAVFLRTARDRGIRVIADLVVNHTSDEHPWFLSACEDRSSPYRDWYVWRDEIPPGGSEDLVFPDEENSNWEWHEGTGQYDHIRLVYSLVFALPGAPVLFYGEEIGMAENLEIPGRMSVRSPMQWSDGPNGGFSTAPADDVFRPVVSGPKWGPKAISVAAQEHEPNSMLNWMERLIRRRREMPEVAFGQWSFIPFPDAAIFALRYDW